ncbi:MAG TPA: M1 family aminopeptidase [Candidatus Eisenbacteria bacterium]
MPVSDPLFHPVFLGRRAAMETAPFEPYPPSGRNAWSGPDSSRRDLEFLVRHTRLNLAVDFDAKGIRGSATLTIESLRDGLREVLLDAAELRIESVRSGRARLRHAAETERLRVTLPKPLRTGARAVIEIEYAANPRKGLFFVGPTEAEPGRAPTAWTQGQADDTHWWMPCLESTENRMTLEQIVTAPAGYRVIGNGRLAARRPSRRGRAVTWHWRQETAHPAYLTSLVIGKYAELRDRAGKVPLFHYVPRGEERQGRAAFRKTARMIAVFGKAFGAPYPYPKYAQTVVPDFTYGGMENTSATTLFDRMLEHPGDSLDEGYDSLVAHELAHQWWGDLVTCRHWSEGWLNEGFATYSEILWREADAGQDDADFARLEQICSFLVEDGSEYRRALVETRYERPCEIFDRHLYEKGAVVLHMLRVLLGEDAWRRSLGRYLERHALGPVETGDLRRACEEATGRNLAWFFDQWVHRGGHPELRVSRRWTERTKSLTLTIEQVQDDDGVTPVFRLPMTLEIVAGSRRRRLSIELRGRRETITVPVGARPRYVALDPEHHVLKLLDFPRTDEELLYGLARSPYALERIRCARELSSRSEARAVEALTRALRRDRFWGVRAAAAVSLGEIGRRVTGMTRRLAVAARGEQTRVRRAAIWALGWIGGERAVLELTQRAMEEPSTFNAGWALAGLARINRPGAYAAALAALGRTSHRDMLQILALDAMAALKDPRGLDVFLELTHPRYRNETRSGATKAIGKLGTRTAEGEARLLELLYDRWFRVRSAAAWSLWKIKSPKAEGAIEAALREEIMDLTRVAFREALAGIRRGR